MRVINLEMAITDLKLTSVSPSVAKRFIRNIDHWLDSRVIMSVPHIYHLVTCTLEELYAHGRIKDSNLEKIHFELRQKYGIHFEMTDHELRSYYNVYLGICALSPNRKSPKITDRHRLYYSLEEDIVESVAIYRKRYKDKNKNPWLGDIVLKQYSDDHWVSGIKDLNAFAAKVIEENKNEENNQKN